MPPEDILLLGRSRKQGLSRDDNPKKGRKISEKYETHIKFTMKTRWFHHQDRGVNQQNLNMGIKGVKPREYLVKLGGTVVLTPEKEASQQL